MCADSDDFIWRMRKIHLPPRLASNNIGSREAVPAQLKRLQPRHASCSSRTAYARPVIRNQLVVAEVEVGQGREVREGAAHVACA